MTWHPPLRAALASALCLRLAFTTDARLRPAWRLRLHLCLCLVPAPNLRHSLTPVPCHRLRRRLAPPLCLPLALRPPGLVELGALAIYSSHSVTAVCDAPSPGNAAKNCRALRTSPLKGRKAREMRSGSSSPSSLLPTGVELLALAQHPPWPPAVAWVRPRPVEPCAFRTRQLSELSLAGMGAPVARKSSFGGYIDIPLYPRFIIIDSTHIVQITGGLRCDKDTYKCVSCFLNSYCEAWHSLPRSERSPCSAAGPHKAHL